MEPPPVPSTFPRKRRRVGSRSAGGAFHTPPPPNIYTPAPKDYFLPLTLKIVLPGGLVDTTGPATQPPPPPADATQLVSDATNVEYKSAIDRIGELHTHLTPDMRSSLTSLLSVLHTDVSTASSPDPTPNHPLIAKVVSLETPDDTLRGWADTIDRGLRAFAARGGRRVSADSRSASPGTSTASSRSQKVQRDCGERDNRTCVLTGKEGDGAVAHILPFSVRDSKAGDFWEFISLFRGREATEQLKESALGSRQDTDALANVFWLAHDSHSFFDKGWLTILPQLVESQFPYDPNTVSEYTALVEFPSGTRKAPITVIAYVDNEPQIVKMLRPGDSIRFTTRDPIQLPLPHPLLFQLHALVNRIMAMKAAAGYPVFAGDMGWESDEEWLPYDDVEVGEDGPYSEHDDKEGSSDSENLIASNQKQAIQHWLHPPEASAVFPPPPPHIDKKRRRDEDDLGGIDEPEMPDIREYGIQGDGERARAVKVVEGEGKMRMNDRLRMMGERLGRKPTTAAYLAQNHRYLDQVQPTTITKKRKWERKK